jgi:hypothetical protein
VCLIHEETSRGVCLLLQDMVQRFKKGSFVIKKPLGRKQTQTHLYHLLKAEFGGSRKSEQAYTRYSGWKTSHRSEHARSSRRSEITPSRRHAKRCACARAACSKLCSAAGTTSKPRRREASSSTVTASTSSSFLNYLRDGKLPSGLSNDTREALAAEVEYYQLEDREADCKPNCAEDRRVQDSHRLFQDGEQATTLSLQVLRAASRPIRTPRRNFAPISSSIRKRYRASARTRGTARSRRVGANLNRRTTMAPTTTIPCPLCLPRARTIRYLITKP